MVGMFAKLAGQTSSRAMAEWAKLRQHELSQLLHLKRESMPHASTWSRVLAGAVDPNEVEQILGHFFENQARSRLHPGTRHLCLDGKTLKGTIPLGQTQGVHLLAAYPRKASCWHKSR